MAADPALATRSKWLAAGAVLVLLGLVLRTAWVAEDAYITLRTVDNWVHGFGLRWNTDERVQSYTHPLWMLLLSAGYFVTREAFFTTIALSVVTTSAAVMLLVKGARSPGHALACVGLLVFSPSFIEFSTSGLENPLTHLLVLAFALLYVRADASLRALALCAALLALNRLDALLILLPALAHLTLRSARQHGRKRTLIALTLGFAPFIAWELFSLFYYGFWVPNTAYAKLNTGISSAALRRQGITYLINCFGWDPASGLSIVLGLVAAFSVRQRRLMLLGIGTLLYLFYVVSIGGDFMLGRFLTLPLFLAIVLLSLSPVPLEEPAYVLGLVLPFGVLLLHPNATQRYAIGDLELSGVADERSYYDRSASLMMFSRNVTLPNHVWIDEGARAAAGSERVLLRGNVGYFGFAAGPKLHIIDPVALTEPLLARLPVEAQVNWRIGHWERHIPTGFVETVRSGKCVMEDQNLCEFYARLRDVVAGDLWSWRRFESILGFQLGKYDALIDRARYRHPSLQREPLSYLSALVAEGVALEEPGVHPLRDDGLEVELGATSHAEKLSVSLHGDDSYELSFRRGKDEIGRLEVQATRRPVMRSHELSVPTRVRRAGFDRIRITPIAGDGRYAIGHLHLNE